MTQFQQSVPEANLSIDTTEYLDAKINRFSDINIHPKVISAVNNLGWASPTPVQSLCLPFTIKGRHVAGFAQTGTGKTGVFLITLLDAIMKAKEASTDVKPENPRALIIVPTRELAIQICNDAEALTKELDVSFLAVYGGVDYDKQAQKIKQGVDVIVATPGRLKDYFKKKLFSLEDCKQFVCDEADRMFDMGFIEDIEYFLGKLEDDTQKLLFSATTNEQVKELAFEYLEKPEYISVNPEVITPENIEQKTFICESENKVKVLLGLLRDEQPTCSIIFTNTKVVADWLHYKLTKNGFEADIITGDLPQKKRINLIRKIKKGEIKALIATDVASRGLHIADVSHVFNFDLPDEPANYIHRIGRTARAGAKGKAFSLVCEDYGQNFEAIQGLLGDIVLESSWYDPAYLEIEDKSGNPYKDPEFKGSTPIRSDNSNERRDQRRTRPAPEGRVSEKKASRSSHQRSKEPRTDRHHEGRAKKKRPRSQKPRNVTSDRRPTARKTAAAAPPQSIGGMFKKIVRAIFGRQK